MPNISEKQNAPAMLKLLRARLRLYSNLKSVQRGYLLLTVFLPLAALLASTLESPVRQWISLAAVLAAGLDVVVFDPLRKRQMKVAAVLQEEFDCGVLDLPWNSFVVGKKVAPEEVSDYGAKPFTPKREEKLQNWYPQAAADLHPNSARLVCQRTNLWYDMQLRESYKRTLLAAGIAYILIIVALSWTSTLADTILYVLVPLGPLSIWIAREHNRVVDTLQLLRRLLAEIDSSLEKFSAKTGDSTAQRRARELQDAIFTHRCTSPLVSDLIYRLNRTRLEGLMQSGAASFVSKIRRSAEAAQ